MEDFVSKDNINIAGEKYEDIDPAIFDDPILMLQWLEGYVFEVFNECETQWVNECAEGRHGKVEYVADDEDDDETKPGV